MTIERTPDGKWVLYRAIDGQRLERWPVDSHHLLATGEYTTDPTIGLNAPSVSVAPGSAMENPLATPPALPVEHSPGVPLVAVTEGTEAAPFASPPKSPTRRSRK